MEKRKEEREEEEERKEGRWREGGKWSGRNRGNEGRRIILGVFLVWGFCFVFSSIMHQWNRIICFTSSPWVHRRIPHSKLRVKASALTSVAKWGGCPPTKQCVTGSSPSGHMPGLQVWSQSRHVGVRGNHSTFLIHIDISLPSSLSKNK